MQHAEKKTGTLYIITFAHGTHLIKIIDTNTFNNMLLNNIISCAYFQTYINLLSQKKYQAITHVCMVQQIEKEPLFYNFISIEK